MYSMVSNINVAFLQWSMIKYVNYNDTQSKKYGNGKLIGKYG